MKTISGLFSGLLYVLVPMLIADQSKQQQQVSLSQSILCRIYNIGGITRLGRLCRYHKSDISPHGWIKDIIWNEKIRSYIITKKRCFIAKKSKNYILPSNTFPLNDVFSYKNPRLIVQKILRFSNFRSSAIVWISRRFDDICAHIVATTCVCMCVRRMHVNLECL